MSASPVSARGGASVPGGTLTTTLRALLEQRRKEGSYLRLDEAIAIIVPLCLDLKQRHERGEKLYVHPSSIGRGPDGFAAILPRSSLVPIQARDRACVAPELQGTLEPGMQKASVFSVGAVLYEMLTAYPIGPAMRRPREVNPDLPDAVETLLSKALVGDPQHRPDDLGALASALHHLAPMESISPPDADEAALDRSDEYAVDVRMSMLPPHEMISMVPLVSAAPAPMTSIPISMSTMAPSSASMAPLLVPKIPAMPAMPVMPAAMPAVPPSSSSSAGMLGLQAGGPGSARDPAVRLMELKARLESDPRPRYTVHQNRMDHGPFSAVELLQQIASNKFRPEDGIRDELSGQDRPIKDWEEFAPFADQAKLRRDIATEKKEVSAAIEQEKSTGIAKAILAGAVVVALLGGVGFWFFEVRGSRSDSVDIADDPGALDISIDGGARIVMKRGVAGAGGGGKGPSGYSPGGMSYEAALGSNKEEITIGNKAGPDLSDGQLAGPLRNASFIGACGIPASTHVTVRTAIRQGRAVGVSVSTDPPNGAMASCVDRSVRGLSWPSNPHMDSFTTRY